MKTIIALLLMALALSAEGHQSSTTPLKVSDAAAAVSIAENALAKVYGKRKIESERPFTATLSEGVWHVAGTLYCKDEKGRVITNRCVGGDAMADIRERDGRVLRTGHEK